MIDGFTTRSGTRIHYLDNAPPDPIGLPILFSPGFTDYAEEYEEVLEFFLPRRVLVVEVRGRGKSDAPASGYTSADQASDLRAVLDEEGISRFHLMTFSRGTTWGLDLVFADPARVATVSIGDYWPREHALDPEMSKQVMAGRFRGTPMTDRVPPHVIPSLFAESTNRDLHDELAATGLPVLVATGTEDGCLLTPENMTEYRDRVPGVETVVIDAAAHDLFRPDRLAYPRAVEAFITKQPHGT